MDKHYRKRDLLKFTLPSMAMMLFTSLYGIVDGFFIANWCGTTAFAAVNFIMPLIMILSAFGFMFGTGGSALVAKVRGQGDDIRANRYFSLITYCVIVFGLILSLVGFFLMRPIAALLGATGDMLDIAELYGRINMISLTGFMLQSMFQVLFSTAGKPEYGFRVTLAAGVANMVLDWLFVGVFGWGVVGAAVATNISELTGGFVPLFYFARQHNTSYLRLGTALNEERKIEWWALGQTCLNGSSEMMANIAMSLVGLLYNFQLLRYLGEYGVAAYGAIMYVSLLFAGAIMGYVMGVGPLMSYQYGAQNRFEMRSLLNKSIVLVTAGGAIGFILAEVAAVPVMGIFTGYDPELHAFSVHACRIYAICCIIMGLNVYASGLFTSLNNGPVSALIEFVRTLIFECGAVIVIPLIFGADFIWTAVTFAEVAALILSVCLIKKYYNRYFA